MLDTYYYLRPAQEALFRRYINGTSNIDERAILFEGGAAAGTLDTYYLLKELYSVTGWIKKNGILVEGYAYDTYGQVRIWSYPDFDFDRDGDAESDDYDHLFMPGEGFGDCTADGDMDGDVDYDDLNMFVTIPAASDIPTELYVSGVGRTSAITMDHPVPGRAQNEEVSSCKRDTTLTITSRARCHWSLADQCLSLATLAGEPPVTPTNARLATP